MTDEAVRIATREDEEEIVQLIKNMHQESGLFPLSEERVRQVLALAFDRKGGLIGAIGKTGEIKAIIYLLISRFWYTDDNHLEELFNYTVPDHRKSNHAKTMIEFAKKCSDEIKGPDGSLPLVIGVLTNSRMEGKVRLYRRILGYPAGAFFVHNGRWSSDHSTEDFWKTPFPKRLREAGAREQRSA